MTSKTLILSAAAACMAAVGLSASAASADPWRGYGDRDDRYYERGYSVDVLFQREARLADRIRDASRDGRFNRWEAGNAWRGLGEAREQTAREAREHGRFLPADDYFRISARLDGLDRFIRQEAHDWD
jgi:hypothetical protein